MFAVAVLWLGAGVVLLFDLGQLPLRAINRARSRPVDRAATTPLYWRAWGAILLGSGLVLLVYAMR
jgi:hypothetical protein